MKHMASALLRLVSAGTVAESCRGYGYLLDRDTQVTGEKPVSGSPSPVVAVAEGLGFGLARAGRSRVTMPSEFV